MVKEIGVNVAYRWFLGFRLTDKVPDASTLSQSRRRRFTGTDIEQRIFDGIVEQAIKHKLMGAVCSLPIVRTSRPTPTSGTLKSTRSNKCRPPTLLSWRRPLTLIGLPRVRMGQILGSNAMQACHPFLQSPVMGIDVLNVDGTSPHTSAGPILDDLMGYAATTGKGGIHGGPIAAQHRLWIN